MFPNANLQEQYVRPLRIAIVEDNATARTNLRSHLMAIDNYDIASYSNGKELRNGLRLNNVDLILMDFHLGQSKNGVEWIQQLQESKLFKANMGLVFITSDGMPQTIGQILDLYPDFILIKPYTIKSLRLNLSHYLRLRAETMPVLDYMAQQNDDLALSLINKKIQTLTNKRFKNDFLKLKGRLLMREKQYNEAVELYSGILKKSSNVLWAHWGLIKSEFFTGKWHHCQKLLNHLVSESLTKDKAYEWLASVALGKEEYKEAEALLSNIKDSELSIQATRLKVLCYKMLDKNDQAQSLLEKKIQSNLTVKDRMIDYAMELARFHIHLAESANEKAEPNDHGKAQAEKDANLSAARRLIGKANRGSSDRQAELQKNYMLALAYMLEGNIEKAEKMIEQASPFQTVSNIKTTTLLDAVKIWFGVGNSEKATEILMECDDALLSQDSHIERLICTELVNDIEQDNDLQKERALQSNDRGTKLYINKQYADALVCFHKAYKTLPGVPAFALNLLQCMADMQQFEYQGIEAESLYKDLATISLSDKNEIRLAHIKVNLGIN
ncbi:response regulator [Glaciecola sp. 2405UD65-10]|uniref:response regulator n=1 Tax=Glaciecola sp. 2405UD65-10 TaxID=3397244 RepID=UPI003B5C9812